MTSAKGAYDEYMVPVRQQVSWLIKSKKAAVTWNYKLEDSGNARGGNSLPNPMSGEEWNNYLRERYGYDNVNWETAFDSPIDIIDIPSSVTRMNHKDYIII